MTWEVDLVEAVRVYINDIDAVEAYSDSRIERVVVIAAAQVIQEIQFPTTYSVDIQLSTISPDPTNEPKDTSFLILVALKTSCLILSGEVKQYSLVGGISVTDAGSNINMGNVFKNVQETAKGVCLAYAHAKMEYKMGQSSANSTAVTTPTTWTNGYCNSLNDYRSMY